MSSGHDPQDRLPQLHERFRRIRGNLFGPTPEWPQPHWYRFDYDGTTGAEVRGTLVVIHLADGLRGDGDLAANGAIDFLGGLAFDRYRALWHPF